MMKSVRRMNVMTETRSKKAKVYYSDVDSLLIKDAITGEIYPWKVGSNDEKRFFKVKDNSLVNKYDSEYQNGHTLFYKNPEEYMKFNNVDLDDEIINKWNMRQNNFI